MWVSFTVSAVLVALLPGNATSDFLPTGLSRAVFVAGCCLAIAGLIIEVIADHQKARFRQKPENKGRFIQTGLWSRRRHPNYFGEIVFWFGLALAASPAMSGAQHLAWLSPLFVYLLLTRLSGIPTLVKRGQQLWGDDPEYQAYLARTPRLVPRVIAAGGGPALLCPPLVKRHSPRPPSNPLARVTGLTYLPCLRLDTYLILLTVRS